jgi:hypothetical protein
VDYFSKYIFVKPIKSKQGSELTATLEETIPKFEHMAPSYKIGAIVSDQEGGTRATSFVRVLNQHGIRHIMSSTPVGMVERAIGTIKALIHKRIIGLKLDQERWIDMLDKVVNLYNNKLIHSTIRMTPRDALKPTNKLEVHLNIQMKAKFNRPYPELRKGDNVRVAIKKGSFTKSYHPTFSEEVYKVLEIHVDEDGTNEYLINNRNRKLYQRHELLRVTAVEDKDG